jgi:hypothetical protein
MPLFAEWEKLGLILVGMVATPEEFTLLSGILGSPQDGLDVCLCAAPIASVGRVQFEVCVIAVGKFATVESCSSHDDSFTRL